MKRVLILLVSPFLSLGESLGGCLTSFASLCRAELPPPTIKSVAVQRQDLLRGEMPEQPAPRPTMARVTRDQRPDLRMFTTPRNDFAY